MTLCSSKKKALSGEDWNLYDPVYGVKKGNTYYVKVRALYNTSGMYQLKVTNTGVSEKSGTTKSKAVTIKKGSTKKELSQREAARPTGINSSLQVRRL